MSAEATQVIGLSAWVAERANKARAEKSWTSQAASKRSCACVVSDHEARAESWRCWADATQVLQAGTGPALATLKELAKKGQPAELAFLRSQEKFGVGAGEGRCAEVVGSITDMISRLQAEAS